MKKLIRHELPKLVAKNVKRHRRRGELINHEKSTQRLENDELLRGNNQLGIFQNDYVQGSRRKLGMHLLV